jgi:hypothetical protein
LSHPDAQIQELVINWETPKYNLSDGWIKYEIRVPQYEENLGEIISKVVFRIYLLKIKKEITDLINQLDTEDEAEQDILMNALEEKNATKKLIAEELGSIL